jgi:hypothetical protein
VGKFDDKIRRMKGDILIHAGDLSDRGTRKEMISAFRWLCSLDNFKFKVLIAGNMDGIGLDYGSIDSAKERREQLFSNDKNDFYLENDSCKVLGVKIYGCPYTPKFDAGFQYNRGSTLARGLWNRIPNDCDILVSHGPPAVIFDTNSRGRRSKHWRLSKLRIDKKKESFKGEENGEFNIEWLVMSGAEAFSRERVDTNCML